MSKPKVVVANKTLFEDDVHQESYLHIGNLHFRVATRKYRNVTGVMEYNFSARSSLPSQEPHK